MSKVIYIGDSHVFHCFSSDNVDSMYLIDVTLNQIRKGNGDIQVKYLDYDDNIKSSRYAVDDGGDMLSHVINSSECDYVVLSIGEIDIRYHLVKQLEIDNMSIDKIVDVYNSFISKINKKVIICSITPPGIDNTNDYTKRIDDRSSITKKINDMILKMCEECGYIYFDNYSEYNLNGILDPDKSDGGVHINKRFIGNNIEKIKNIINENSIS